MKRRSESIISTAESETSISRRRIASIDDDGSAGPRSESEDQETSKALTAEEISTILEELREAPNGIENKLSNTRVRQIVSVMTAWWSCKPSKEVSLLDHCASRWSKCADGKTIKEKMDSGTLTSIDLRFVYNKEMFKRIRLDAILRQRGFIETADKSCAAEDLAGVGYAHDIGQIQECISRTYQYLLADLQMRKTLDKSIDQGCPALNDPLGYVPYTEGKLNDYQTFIMFLLRQLHDSGYRRYNGSVYEQVVSPTVEGFEHGSIGRFSSHAWIRVCDIKEFILNNAKKEYCFTQWQSMTASNSLERAVTYLSHCTDAEFSELKPDRLWHSFHNGLYHVESLKFFKYGDPHIPSHIVACKYHDQTFDTSIMETSWADVSVPFVQSVLEYQFAIDGKEEGVKDEETQSRIIMWLYAFLGRLLFEVGEKDKWQVIPFIVGRAGTGKSLLLKSAGHFFNAEDVEILANNSQRGFGLETLIDKLVWMCLEVKHDFTLDQAQLQSMVSGEPVSIMRKNKTALSVVWKVPGIMAGNEPAAWVDNSGSMSRRVVICYFDRKVTADKVDPNLDNKIKAHIGNFLHKCASAYHAATSEFGNKDIWGSFVDENGKKDTILPRYFHAAKMRLQIITDPLMSFLRSDVTIYLTSEPGKGMPWERFKAIANAYFQRESYKGFIWKENKYKAVFEDLGIQRVKIDAKFLQERGCTNGIFVDDDFNEHNVGTDWLIGVAEKKEKPMGHTVDI